MQIDATELCGMDIFLGTWKLKITRITQEIKSRNKYKPRKDVLAIKSLPPLCKTQAGLKNRKRGKSTPFVSRGREYLAV